jgi:hypothetical protein
MRDNRRTTLVVRGAQPSSRAWDASDTATNRILFVKAPSMLSFVLDHRSEDVDRIILDGAATADEFLDLLASLPLEFLGDFVLIRSDNNSFISTAGRADGRLLYAMTATDLQFYLETLGLVATKAAIAA